MVPAERLESVGQDLCADYLHHLRAEFPGLRVIEKVSDGPSRAIDVALRLLTLGGQSAYITRYVTTLGSRIYLPLGWDARSELERYVVLRHEAVHLRQFRRYTWLGMAFLYCIPWLPLGLAWGRARLEWEAYHETLRATAEVFGRDAVFDRRLHDHIVEQFTGPAYGWMWPFEGQIRSWIADALAELGTQCDADAP